MKNLIKLISLCAVAGFLFTACEGPAGPAGKDANETCTQCHNPTSVDAIATEFELSKHGYGEAAFEEAGSTGCGPCHLSEAFKFVVKNNTTSAFAIVAPATTYSNQYATSTSKAYGEINCFTCHANLHSTFTDADYKPVTTTAEVFLTMYGGLKSVNLTQDGGISNLCVKCHQPRPFTRTFGDKNVVDYAALVAAPTTVFFDGNAPTSTANVNTVRPSYRTHTHYGTAGMLFAGVGGLEFAGSLPYEKSQHATVASCQDCHMAPVTGKAGGHTFVAKGNFNGCTPCHATVTNASQAASYWATPRAEIKLLLDQLGAKIKYNGVEVLNRNPNATENYSVNYDATLDGVAENITAGVNLWTGVTTNKYDGYLNIYDPITNPLGGYYNTGGLFKNPNPSGWNAAQVTYNNTLPVLVLTNAQFGAIINFQLALRDYSLGIHNYKYTKALLTNTIAIIP